MRPHTLIFAVILIALALPLVGCGNSDQALEDAAKKSETASGAIILDKPASGPGKAMMKAKTAPAQPPKAPAGP